MTICDKTVFFQFLGHFWCVLKPLWGQNIFFCPKTKKNGFIDLKSTSFDVLHFDFGE